MEAEASSSASSLVGFSIPCIEGPPFTSLISKALPTTSLAIRKKKGNGNLMSTSPFRKPIALLDFAKQLPSKKFVRLIESWHFVIILIELQEKERLLEKKQRKSFAK